MNSDVSRTAFLKAVSLCSDWQAHLDWFLQREQLYVLVLYQKVSSCNMLRPGVPGARLKERSTNDYTGYFLFIVMENVAECNLREEGLILLTAWEDTVYYGRERRMAGVGGSWSLCVCTQKAESRQEMRSTQAHLYLPTSISAALSPIHYLPKSTNT